DRGVKRAPFYVLAGAQMPCILIEGGFLTNPHEAKLLTDPNYLDALAEGIAEGVIRYIREYEGE
ncbi:MAG TPA: N-acetylmuramoyl-L-alanine amidase, partial [Proteobacteria bacterium]|nr:N-acetylmuramoyl-L-alanine amidase [Pseudomonadota bacterium]